MVVSEMAMFRPRYADKKAYIARRRGNRTMHRVFVSYLVVFGVGFCCAQESKPASWLSLIKAGKCDEARSLCTGWRSSKDIAQLVEAHKCLANVALCGDKDAVTLQANDQGGGTLAGAYKPEAVDEALGHLDQASSWPPKIFRSIRGVSIYWRFPFGIRTW